MHPSALNIGAYVKNLLGIKPQASAAATVNGATIDRLGYGSCSVAGLTGASTGTPTTQSAAFKLQHGDAADASDMADLTGATGPTITAVDTGAEAEFDLSAAKRYIRVVCVLTFSGGSSPTLLVASSVALGGATTKPAA